MENKLEALFGYQRFNENADLQKVIDSVHARYSGKKKRTNCTGTDDG